jgi:PilZ domain
MDQRRARRKPIRYDARLAVGPGQFHDCVLSDVSDTGARIEVQDAKKLPDRFLLLLSENGAARRFCRVAWRKTRYVGVAFEKNFTDVNGVAPAPRAEDTESEEAVQASEPTTASA